MIFNYCWFFNTTQLLSVDLPVLRATWTSHGDNPDPMAPPDWQKFLLSNSTKDAILIAYLENYVDFLVVSHRIMCRSSKASSQRRPCRTRSCWPDYRIFLGNRRGKRKRSLHISTFLLAVGHAVISAHLTNFYFFTHKHKICFLFMIPDLVTYYEYNRHSCL